MWVYREMWNGYEVGYQLPPGYDDSFQDVERYDTKEEARQAVRYLNGGCDAHTS